MPKTDEELMQSLRGPNSTIMSQMTNEEKQKYMDYVIQDRIFLSVKDVKIMDSGLGQKICSLSLQVVNNTPRLLKHLSLKAKWGDASFPAEFNNIPIVRNDQLDIALAGSVCRDLLTDVTYDVISCSMEGLSEEQCKMRIAKQ